jgi:hypothetical protein
MNRAAADRRLRLGFGADGTFKVITAAGIVVLLPRLTDGLDVAPWLVLVTAAALVVCGAREVAFSSRSPDLRPHIKYLVAYDAGWLIVTALAVGLVRDGAGELWFAYQALGSAALAVVFARAGTSATPRR